MPIYNAAFVKRLSYEVVHMNSEYLEKVMQLIRLMEPHNLVFNKKRRCYSINFAGLSGYVLGGIRKILTAFHDKEDDDALKNVQNFLATVDGKSSSSISSTPSSSVRDRADSTDLPLPIPSKHGGFKRAHSLQPVPGFAGVDPSTLGLSPRAPREGVSGVPLTPPTADDTARFTALYAAAPALDPMARTTGQSDFQQINMAANLHGIKMDYRTFQSNSRTMSMAAGVPMMHGTPLNMQSHYMPKPRMHVAASSVPMQPGLQQLHSAAAAVDGDANRKRKAATAAQDAAKSVRTNDSTKKRVTKPRARRGKSKSGKPHNFICEFIKKETGKPCGASFARRSGLNSHMRTHTGEKPYACKFCGKRFPNSSNCNAHMRSHTNLKPYKCDWPGCTKAYTHSTSLKEHKCKHTGEFLHQCPDCGKKFTVNSNYKRHREKVNCKAKMEQLRAKQAKQAKRAVVAAI